MKYAVVLRLIVCAELVCWTTAQGDAKLTGTWSTKSRKVFTGPGFYDPVNDKIFEPELPGISYSFTNDGHYEEAYYRAISQPSRPSCPEGIIQWQHGTFQILSNGSLLLTPISVDGRQLLSSPCAPYKQSVYTRYHQEELFERFEVYTDPYHNVPRLNLYRFDGSPMNPMYLAYSPPQMLPTQTLNPTATASGAKSTGTSKAKRGLEDADDFMRPLNARALREHRKEPYSPDILWWIGAGMTAIGSVAYFCF